jgi:hypothetical protein
MGYQMACDHPTPPQTSLSLLLSLILLHFVLNFIKIRGFSRIPFADYFRKIVAEMEDILIKKLACKN